MPRKSGSKHKRKKYHGNKPIRARSVPKKE
jgi:hypothetical protein